MVSKMASECTLLVHLGDTKGGGGPCNDTLMAEPIRIMLRTGSPVLYTLGDNEATDCHRSLSRSNMTDQGGVDGGATAQAAEFLTAEVRKSQTSPSRLLSRGRGWTVGPPRKRPSS
jgi:hypothetical protein